MLEIFYGKLSICFQDEKKSHVERLSVNWESNRQLLLDGLTFRAEELKKELIAKGYSADKLADEVSVILLADLQEKQKSESNAMCAVITDKVSTRRRTSRPAIV